MQFCLWLRFLEVNKLSIPGHVSRGFSTRSDYRSAMTTSNDIMALSVFSCLCFRGNLLSWFTIFSYCAAQETMLRNLQRQVDFQVVNCKGNKDPRICPPTFTKTYHSGAWFFNMTCLNVGWAEGKFKNPVLLKESRTFFVADAWSWLILKLSFGLSMSNSLQQCAAR